MDHSLDLSVPLWNKIDASGIECTRNIPLSSWTAAKNAMMSLARDLRFTETI
jgi:hypothetical protein